MAIGASIVEPTVATVLVLLAAVPAMASVWVSDPSIARLRMDHASVVRLPFVGIALAWAAGIIAAPVPDLAFLGAFTLAIAVGLVGMMGSGRMALIATIGAIAAQVALAMWMIAALPRPVTQDVDLFPREGTAAMLRGENPYEITFQNLYGPGTPLYAPQVQVGERLDVGYPYPPLTLLLAVPGEVLAGDHRYGAAVAVGLTSLMIALTQPGPVARGIALLLAFSPLAFRVVYNGWSEPFVALFLAGSVLAAARAPSSSPVTLGLLVAAKQYTAPSLLVAVILLRSLRDSIGAIRSLAISSAVALATILPFLLWNPGRFVHSVVVFHILQPVRTDAVSIPGWLARTDVASAPAWIAFLAAFVALIAVLRWAPRTPTGFASGVAVIYLVFFLSSKQAFMNYYYFVLVALLAAAAATISPREGLHHDPPMRSTRRSARAIE